MNAENAGADWSYGGFKWRPNGDFPVYDIEQITTGTREECGRFCVANPQYKSLCPWIPGKPLHEEGAIKDTSCSVNISLTEYSVNEMFSFI
jgi:hypothetical protein